MALPPPCAAPRRSERLLLREYLRAFSLSMSIGDWLSRSCLQRTRSLVQAANEPPSADSGFVVPALYDYCERKGITYTIGLIPNPRLPTLAAPLLAQAHAHKEHTGQEKVRLVGEATYQAGPWSTERRVLIKVEVLPQGPNTRFVVTNHSATAKDAVSCSDGYVDRGEVEQ